MLGEENNTTKVVSLNETMKRLEEREMKVRVDPQPQAPQMHQFSSGAKSSVVKPRFDLLPVRGLKLGANRFQYGASRHGERNYTKGGGDPTFIRDRINHLIEHCLKFAATRQTKDLEAIICNGMMLAELRADDGAGQYNESSLGGDSAL